MSFRPVWGFQQASAQGTILSMTGYELRSGFRDFLKTRLAAGSRLSRGALAAMAAFSSAVPARGTEPDPERLGPKASASVYWVGHSLVEGKAKSSWGEISLMTLVGRFAEQRGLAYRMADHTLWGSPMSALWRGSPHSYERDASAMVGKREDFERGADQYDTLVVTESLPVDWAVQNEYSSYYLRRFACTLIGANPAARVYLYQTWVNLQDSKRTRDWRADMIAQRQVWEGLARDASRPHVAAPGGWFARLGFDAHSDGGCDKEIPVAIVPAGQALVALSDRLATPEPGDTFTWPDGRPLQLTDLFANPFVNWPAAAAGSSGRPAASGDLKLRDPTQPHDDIHPSGLGIYFAALVHFATLYRQTPVGLAAPDEFGENLARALQCVAWSTVVADAHSSVLGTPECASP
jgi:hypothetical protein